MVRTLKPCTKSKECTRNDGHKGRCERGVLRPVKK